jgi:hypothetical protein
VRCEEVRDALHWESGELGTSGVKTFRGRQVGARVCVLTVDVGVVVDLDRASFQPRANTCPYCIELKGYHSWRQVGFDREVSF